MTGMAHLAAGAALGALVCLPAGRPLAGAVVGGVSALLADADHPGSYVGRLIRPLAVRLEERCGHRDSFTHTAQFCLPVGLAVGIPAAFSAHTWLVVLAGGVGGLSHLALDAATKSGVRPLRLWLPRLPRGGRRWTTAWDLGARWWNTRAAHWEENRWVKRRLGGPVTTGNDWREEVVIAVGFLVVILAVFGV